MEIFDNLLMTLALGGLAVSLALFASAWLYPHLRRAWDKATALARAVFCGAVAVACLYGGAKHGGTISYPKTDTDVAYLVDAGSYVTNDAVHVAFTRVPTVPDTATFYLDYCAIDATNAQGVATNWVNAKTATFADLTVPFDFAFAAATNYNWMAYTDWTPGPAVQTNGVWHAYWGVDKKQGRYFIPVRTCVRDGGEVIATPKSKWDYEFYTNYVAWVADDAAAGLADGATVSTWTSNDGRAATKGRYADQPTIALGSFNGHAGVSCTNGYFDVSAANNPLAGETQWTVCAVLKTSAYGRTDGSWYNMNGAFGTENANIVNDWSIVKNASGNLGFGMGVLETQNDYKLMGDANCVDGLPHVVIVSLSHDGTLTLAVDGAVKTLAVALGANKSPRLVTRIYIGMNFGTSQIFGGEIAELRVYQGAPASAAQRNRIGSELAKKYGATWNAE